jgi:hypothetical protein
MYQENARLEERIQQLVADARSASDAMQILQQRVAEGEDQVCAFQSSISWLIVVRKRFGSAKN